MALVGLRSEKAAAERGGRSLLCPVCDVPPGVCQVSSLGPKNTASCSEPTWTLPVPEFSWAGPPQPEHCGCGESWNCSGPWVPSLRCPHPLPTSSALPRTHPSANELRRPRLAGSQGPLRCSPKCGWGLLSTQAAHWLPWGRKARSSHCPAGEGGLNKFQGTALVPTARLVPRPSVPRVCGPA